MVIKNSIYILYLNHMESYMSTTPLIFQFKY